MASNGSFRTIGCSWFWLALLLWLQADGVRASVYPTYDELLRESSPLLYYPMESLEEGDTDPYIDGFGQNASLVEIRGDRLSPPVESDPIVTGARKSIYFSGAEVSADFPSVETETGHVSISFWIRPDELPDGDRPILSLVDEGEAANQISISVSPDRVISATMPGWGAPSEIAVSLTEDEWQKPIFVVVTYENRGKLELFVNGKLIDHTYLEKEGFFYPRLMLGNGFSVYGSGEGGPSERSFKGSMSHLSLEEGVLDSATVQKRYLAGRLDQTADRYLVVAEAYNDSAQAALDATGAVVVPLGHNEHGQSEYVLAANDEQLTRLVAQKGYESGPGSITAAFSEIFAGLISIESGDSEKWLTYAWGRDVHAGGGPSGALEWSQRQAVSSYIYYNNKKWGGRYWEPNWVKDDTNETWIFNNTRGDYSEPEVEDIHETYYFANTSRLSFYMNYGGVAVTTLSADEPTHSVTGGEIAGSVSFRIPRSGDPRVIAGDGFYVHDSSILPEGYLTTLDGSLELALTESVSPDDIKNLIELEKLEPVTFESDAVEYPSETSGGEVPLPAYIPYEDIRRTSFRFWGDWHVVEVIPAAQVTAIGDNRYRIEWPKSLDKTAVYRVRLTDSLTSVEGGQLNQQGRNTDDSDGVMFLKYFEWWPATHVFRAGEEIDGASLDSTAQILLVEGEGDQNVRLSGDLNVATLRVTQDVSLVPASRQTEPMRITANHVRIDPGATIDVSGMGHGRLPGVALNTGGSHAGRGGYLSDYTRAEEVGEAYGHYRAPVSLGSGGEECCGRMSYGGGAIRIQANMLELDGRIRADGGSVPYWDQGMPGAAGGSVWLTADTLRVAGHSWSWPSISAKGSPGGAEAAGGAGGYVAVQYQTLEEGSYTLAEVLHGSSRGARGAGNAGAGIVYIQDQASGSEVVRIEAESGDIVKNLTPLVLEQDAAVHIEGANVKLETGAGLSTINRVDIEDGLLDLSSSATISDLYATDSQVSQSAPANIDTLYLTRTTWDQNGYPLVVESGWNWNSGGVFRHSGTLSHPEITEGHQLSIKGFTWEMHADETWESVNISDGGKLTTATLSLDQHEGYTLTAQTLDIDATSAIDVSAKGWPAQDEQSASVGGSHAGQGGISSESDAPQPVYGNPLLPVTPGQGGKADSGESLRGGGALKVVVQTLNVAGKIRADGQSAPTPGGSGAAGGALWLDAGEATFTESAHISARGGAGAAEGAGGGGGYIRIAYDSLTGLDEATQVSVAGGTASDGTPDYARGQEGVVYIAQKGAPIHRVTDSVGTGTHRSDLSKVVVYTDQPLDAASVGIDDVVQTGADMQVVSVTVDPRDPRNVVLNLAAPLPQGNYAFTFGPDVRTIDGKGMDLNGNGIVGEPEDAYRASFVVDTVPPARPVPENYTEGQTYYSRSPWIDFSGTRSEPSVIYVNGEIKVPMGDGPWTYRTEWHSDGDYTFTFEAEDAAGNRSGVVTVPVTVDAHVPNVYAENMPGWGDQPEAPTAPLRVNVNNEVALDEAHTTFTVTTREGVPVPGTTSIEKVGYRWSISWQPASPWEDGDYRVVVKVTDPAGNVGQFIRDFGIDRVPPGAPVLDPVPSVVSNGSLWISGNLGENDGKVCVEGPAHPRNCWNFYEPTWRYQVTLAPGDNALRIQYVDFAGNQGEPVTVHVHFDDTAPGPVSLTVQAEGDGRQIGLSWYDYDETANGADIDHYDIYVRPSPFSSVAGLMPVTSTSYKSYRLSGLTRGETVYVAVVAVDRQGLKTEAVSPVAVTPVDVQAPNDAPAVTVTAGADYLKAEWQLTEPVSDDLAEFRLSWGGDSVTVPYVAGQLAYSHTISGLSRDSGYNVQLELTDASGNRRRVFAQDVATWLTPPVIESITGLDGRASLTWQPVPDTRWLQRYSLYAETMPFTSVEGLTPKADFTRYATSGAVAGLENDQTYYVALVAVGNGETYDPSVTTVTVVPTKDREGPAITAVTWQQGGEAPVALEGAVLTNDGTLTITTEDRSGVALTEAYIDDVRVARLLPDTGNSLTLDVKALSDTAHTLRIRTEDTLANATEQTLAFSVDYRAPAAPVLDTPPYTATSAERTVITGHAEAGTQVQILRNEESVAESVAVAEDGTFSVDIPLVEGSNSLTAVARFVGRTKDSVASTPLVITRDSSQPASPERLQASSLPLGKIVLRWSAPDDESIKGYNLYRSDTAFDRHDAPGVSRLNSELIREGRFEDVPSADGEYYYAVVSVNAVGTESLPVFAGPVVSDASAPQATATLEAMGAWDSATGTYGQGELVARLNFSEPLRNTPYVALSIPGGLPVPAQVYRSVGDEKVYEAHFAVGPINYAGEAFLIMSAHDEVGNRGTEITEGRTIRLDTQGPELEALTVTPGSPVRNDTTTAGTGQTLSVSLTLSELPADGAPIKLVPMIYTDTGWIALSGFESGLSLEPVGDGSSPEWTSNLTLPADLGLNADGSPGAVQMTFRLEVADNMGNTTVREQAGGLIQVYQGDLPPLATPTGFAARPLPGGKVQLTWRYTDGAAGYVIYRQAPGEPDLQEWVRVSGGGTEQFTDGDDTPLVDGQYRYAIASLRQENGQESLSAPSQPVEVLADATRPGAPRNVNAILTGQGIGITWDAPEGEVRDGALQYRLYRLDQPEGTTVSDTTGLTPIIDHIVSRQALDTAPSETEHLYVVTAVDEAGNESVPSASVYLNAGLLPVREVRLIVEEGAAPVLSWAHSGTDIDGFDVYSGAGTSPLNAARLTDTNWTDTDWSGGERVYAIKAVDRSGTESPAHEIVLPELSVTLPDAETFTLQRGVFNRIRVQLTNGGSRDVNGARVRIVTTLPDGDRTHWSQPVSIPAGESREAEVVVGGYADLPGEAVLHTAVVIRPVQGDEVELRKTFSVPVIQSGLQLTVEPGEFVRGGEGKARLVLVNTSEVETEIQLARSNGNSPSADVRLRLEDADGNILAEQAAQVATGNVVNVANGDMVARVAPGERYESAALTIPVPANAPDQVRLVLIVDGFLYHTSRDDQARIGGLSVRADVTLTETPYYARITEITPAQAMAGEEITIRGQALSRDGDTPQARVPVTLTLAERSFRQVFTLSTDADGRFEFVYVPQPGESGRYRVQASHPATTAFEEQAAFVVEGLNVWPRIARVDMPRNYVMPVKFRLEAGRETHLSNLRLVYVPLTDAAGNEQPLPDGLQVTLGEPLTLDALQTGYFTVTVSGDNRVPASGVLQFDVVADGHPEALARVRMEYTLTASKPVITPSPSHIQSGVTIGHSVQETLTLTNTGLEMLRNGRLRLTREDGSAVPDWISLLSPAIIGDLGVGESSEVRLNVAPQLVTAEGTHLLMLHLDADNMDTVSIPVLVTVTQSETGSLAVHVSDIYTATLDENGEVIPGLEGARIKLQNEKVLTETYEAVSDVNGEAFFDSIPAGQYIYRATAFDHQPVTGRVWIKPGVTGSEEIFLANQLIQVDFSIREITLEDRYEITLDATFETKVPAPVVVFEPMSINLPMLKKGDVFHGELRLTNYGLIRANIDSLSLPEGDEFARFEFMNTVPDVLEAGQVVVIPYTITALQDFNPESDGGASGGGCLQQTYEALCANSAMCANGSVIRNMARVMWNAMAAGASCAAKAVDSVIGTFSGGGNGGGVGPVIGAGGGYISGSAGFCGGNGGGGGPSCNGGGDSMTD